MSNRSERKMRVWRDRRIPLEFRAKLLIGRLQRFSCSVGGGSNADIVYLRATDGQAACEMMKQMYGATTYFRIKQD